MNLIVVKCIKENGYFSEGDIGFIREENLKSDSPTIELFNEKNKSVGVLIREHFSEFFSEFFTNAAEYPYGELRKILEQRIEVFNDAANMSDIGEMPYHFLKGHVFAFKHILGMIK